MSAGIAGIALVAGILGYAAFRCWARDPGLALAMAAGGIVGVSLVAVSAVFVGRELALRKTVERGLKKLATVDELTGISNRRGFIEHATGVLELAGRVGRPAIVFLADVDGLKAINDRHGHAAGDLALAAAARILQLTFRSSDVIARIGGDEFAVLALVDSRDGGEGILPRLRKNVDFWNGRSNQPFAVSLSIGAVSIDPSQDRLEEILARADKDLYEKKGFRRLVTA
ncbi:MAG TPA: GGDEF domain-containing protein [Thermoanaerobaculia bacterium]|nr:GGDEF domain-containing protein [Thermoanaerobaculia bacterium]